VSKKTQERGFTVLELMIVLTVMLILVGFAVPQVTAMIRTYRLRGTGTNLAGLAQTQRWRAVQDDRFYSARTLAGGGAVTEYADVYPQNVNGSSGNGAGGPIDPRDPQLVINSEVVILPVGSAPGTTALKAQILPPGSGVIPVDGSVAATPVTFGPRGLPCLPTATNGGTVCDSAGGTQAYWIFFQDSITQKWGAVTVTPAGRIQVWYYENGWNVNQM